LVDSGICIFGAGFHVVIDPHVNRVRMNGLIAKAIDRYSKPRRAENG
jgi:hypothetical protein